MPQLYLDLLFCSIFVVVLTALAKYRKAIFYKDMIAYRKMAIGIFFFAGFSLLQLANNQGVFSGLAFPGDDAGRKMMEAGLIIIGMIFLLSGLGAWLPSLVRGRGDRRKLNKRYYCLKMINEALDSRKSLEESYGKVMSCLSSYMGFDYCAAYKYSSRKEMLYLSGEVGFGAGQSQVPEKVSIGATNLKDRSDGYRPIKTPPSLLGGDERSCPDLMVPIAHDNRLLAVFFCRVGNSVRMDDDLIDFISVVAGMVGKQTYARVISAQRDFHKSQHTAYEQISEVCNQASAIRDMVPRLFRIIKGLIGAEYLSVAALDNSGENMIRYTIGSSGRLLLEKGVSRQTRGTDIFSVFESGRSFIESDIKADDLSGEQDGLLLSCGMQSKLICPIKAGKKVVGVLTLGHTDPRHFTSYHLHRIERMGQVIAGVIQREQLHRSLEVREDHMLRLQLMQRQMLDNPPAQAFFDDACDLLTRRMKCTMARISLLDKDRSHLVSQACRSIRETGHDMRTNEPIPLSLLPWHRMTLDAKKLMLINQEDPESRMPPQESASSLIPNIKSAMLVPIMMDDKVKGVISIGEARNWNRRTFGATDLIFAKDLAAKCSLALKIKRMELTADRNREDLKRLTVSGDESSSEMRMRLKSPLTSIIGAVELLRMKGSPDEFSTRYYDLILKSADRIKSMTDEETTGMTEIETLEPEQVIG